MQQSQRRTAPGTAKRVTSPLRQRYADAVRLYESGLSVAQVASHYGITRQAAWDVLKRRGVRMRLKPSGPSNHFYRGGPKASDPAQNRVEKAIAKGALQRPTACESCGASPTFRDGRTGIQAHHPDYNKPLDVMWLCQPCHHAWHAANNPIERRD